MDTDKDGIIAALLTAKMKKAPGEIYLELTQLHTPVAAVSTFEFPRDECSVRIDQR